MRLPLNHDWSFSSGRIDYATHQPMKNAAKVMLPHNAEMTSAQYTSEAIYQRDYTYQLFFDFKDEQPVKILTFEGVMLQFDCYLNGNHLGHFVSGYLPVSIDVSRHIQSKGNVLTVFVDGREDPLIPPFGKVVDYLTFAGIYR